MREACSLIWSALVLLFRSRASLAAEILVLRHQINILRRHSPKRQTFSAMDRLIFAELYRLAPTVLNALAVLKPDTYSAPRPNGIPPRVAPVESSLVLVRMLRSLRSRNSSLTLPSSRYRRKIDLTSSASSSTTAILPSFIS